MDLIRALQKQMEVDHDQEKVARLTELELEWDNNKELSFHFAAPDRPGSTDVICLSYD